MRRAFKAVMNGVTFIGNLWWAGLVLIMTGIDITEPAEENHAD